MQTDEQWIEEFYTELEAHCTGYTRPVDYKERAHRVLSRYYKPVKDNRWDQRKSNGKAFGEM